MPNYFNANSFQPQPQQGGLPGATQGFDHQQDRQRYEQMVGLQKMITAYELAKTHEEMTQGYGQRQAERGAKTSGFDLQTMINQGAQRTPGYVPAMVGGQMGEANTKEAQGRLAMGTLETAIPAGNAANRAKTLEDEARHLEILASDPLQVAMEYENFRKKAPAWAGLPEKYSDEVPKRLRKIQEMITQSPAHRRDIDKETVKGNLDIKKQEVANRGQLDAAKQRAMARVRGVFEEFTRAKNAEKLVLGKMILAEPDLDEGFRRKIEAAMQMAQRAEAERLGRNGVDINNLKDPSAIPNQIHERLGGDGPQPQRSLGKTPE
jgi:hypothetical protein